MMFSEQGNAVRVRRALISVTDKTGLEGLASTLNALGVEILSTGGTARAIAAMGISVRDISDVTRSGEALGGRVKTLHARVHAGILADRDDASHMAELRDMGVNAIDMVVVNLYPFEKVTSRGDVMLKEAVENIDIGGVTMLRSAAKNFLHVTAVSDVEQYADLERELRSSAGKVSLATRKALAVSVFRRTARYDDLIARFLAEDDSQHSGGLFPDEITLELAKIKQLRYGENPHQQAAFYRRSGFTVSGLADAEQLHGKELSFNNIMDLSAAVEIVKPFSLPACAIVKHTNPCGAAWADSIHEAFRDALECDRMSAFGGIVAFNRPVDRELAELVVKSSVFTECMIAPGVERDALDMLRRKKNLRIMSLRQEAFGIFEKREIKLIPGAALIQQTDTRQADRGSLECVTKVPFPECLLESALFGWDVVKSVKSNAIVLARGTRTVGIGAGQMSRVDAAELAIRKAGGRARGSCMVSDAFFPHPDSVELAQAAGVEGIVQPGGSIRDDEVIEACDKYGIPMYMTGVRHFKH